MCLITYSPEGAQALDWATLNYSRKHMNDDGFGLAWFKDDTGVWQVMRSIRSHKLQHAVKKIPQDAPIVIHQRYATHGRVCMENVHPFDAAGALLFHNGTLSGTRASTRYSTKNAKGEWEYLKEDISDTRAYCEDELEPMIMAAGYDWLTDENGIKAIENRIGYGSVFAICIPDLPTPVLVNEGRGDWEKHNGFRIYYSNSYARPGNAYGSYYWQDEEDAACSVNRTAAKVIRVVNGTQTIGAGVVDSDSDDITEAELEAARDLLRATEARQRLNGSDETENSYGEGDAACYAGMFPDSHDTGEEAARWREHEREWDSEWEAYLERDAQAYQARKSGKLVGE